MPRETDKRTPRDLLRVVFRRRWMFLLSASLFALVWLVASHYVLPVKYTAETVFERRSDAASQDSSRNTPESVRSLQLTMPYDLKGYDAVAQAAEDLGLMRGFPRDNDGNLTEAGEARKQDLIQHLLAGLSVTVEFQSEQVDRISVSFTDADPRLVQQLPDTIVRNYINRASNEIVGRLTESEKFLAKEVDSGKKRINELTSRLIEFEKAHAGLLPEDPGAIQDTLQQIGADIDTVRRQQAIAKQNVAKIKEMLSLRQDVEDGKEPIQVVKGPNPDLKRLKDQLQEAQDQLHTALAEARMKEKHPSVVALRAKIADLELRIKDTPEEAVLNTIYGSAGGVTENLDVQLAAAESSVETMSNELERLQKRQSVYQELMSNFGPVRQQYLTLRTSLDGEDAKTKSWEGRLSDIRMDLSAEVAKRRTHLKAVQVAQPQYRPSSPKLAFVLGVALVGGLAFGGGLVFLANMMDRTVRTTEDAAVHFGMPIFAVVDEIVTPEEQARRKALRWTLVPVLSVVLAVAIGLSSLSVVLWLEFPDQHEQWKSSPVSYLAGKVSDVFHRL